MAKNTESLSNLSEEKWQLIRHFHYKPKHGNEDARAENLLSVVNVLNNVGLDYWLTNGTALGMYRDGRFIPWDDDTDLDVMEEKFIPVFDMLKEKFMKAGFIVRAKTGLHKTKMSIFRFQEKLSLRGLYLDKTYRNNRYRLRQNYKYNRAFYEEADYINYRGIKYRVPHPIEKFLIYCYGRKWRTPMRSDNEREYSTDNIRRHDG